MFRRLRKLRRDSRLARRWERRGLQIRAWRKSGQLTPVRDRTAELPSGPLLIATLRNEAVRLPYFLDYYRRLGVVHFLMIDNGSTDGSGELLAGQSDVSLWRTDASYKTANYGVDWVNWLLTRHGAGRWILCVDPDEFLVYPHCDTRRLPALTRWLEQAGRESFATLLLDMYSDKPVNQTTYAAGEDPVAAAPFFDAQNYVVERHGRYHNLWIQGGPRMRVHAQDAAWTAPALNKIPLVRWQKGFAYMRSTHDLLPRRLNRVYDFDGGTRTSGALLHTKFLSILTEKVTEELMRREHYAAGREYAAYAAEGEATRLWTPHSTRYTGWRQLMDLGLIARGGWL